MNRHHPYSGPHDGPRRGGPPGQFGPGPDRGHRFDRGGPHRGRGGFGRGRGGFHGGGSFDGGVGAYDQGPPQGDIGGYNNYDAPSPSQDSFYQNGSYSSTGQYGAATDSSAGFNSYGEYEDEPGSDYGQGGFRAPKRMPQRRERDDKVHDSIIEERIQRERPCRTLFIRNIKYETNSEDVRHLFEEHGEIKTFFDLIANRGMVFVTYYDLRAAERARDRLQGSEISGRPIDVHYSLPRDDHGTRGGDKDKNQLQGTLIVTLRDSPSGQSIDDNEVQRKFQQFGDVKSVTPVNDRNDQRYVEFYDTRHCYEAFDRLRHQGLQDGVMDIVFASESDDPRAQSPRREERRLGGGGFDRGGREWDEPHTRGRRGGMRGRGRGRGGYGGGDDDWDHRDEWGREPRHGRSFDDDYGGDRGRGRGRGGRGGGRGRGGFDDRFDSRGSTYDGPGPSGPPAYGGPMPPASSYAQPPAAAPPVDERLEQAKRVQQLLAALKQPQGGSGTPPAPQGSAVLHPAPNPNPYYQPPPMQAQPPYPGAMPPLPAPGYPPMPPQTGAPQQQQQGGPPPPGGLAGLPPNLLALLQQNNQATQHQSNAPPSMPPQMPPYSMPPPQHMMASPPPVPGVSTMPQNGQPHYQQLMAYLSQKRPQ